MLKDMTRSRVIQVWFAAVTLVVVAGIPLGASTAAGAGALLLALSVVPPTIVLMLCTEPQRVTVRDRVSPIHPSNRL
jgi:hypothetical protein